MVELSTTGTFDRLFSKLPKSVQRKAATKTDFFRENPFHPSLHTEKLHPKHHEVWSFRVDRAYRIIFKFIGRDHVELRFIGHHHSIYDYDMFR
jgi:mRNA-degrading endonuclease RelE of RelBE toxin-antitoxin system